jgi:hypothetical protein
MVVGENIGVLGNYSGDGVAKRMRSYLHMIFLTICLEMIL